MMKLYLRCCIKNLNHRRFTTIGEQTNSFSMRLAIGIPILISHNIANYLLCSLWALK